MATLEERYAAQYAGAIKTSPSNRRAFGAGAVIPIAPAKRPIATPVINVNKQNALQQFLGKASAVGGQTVDLGSKVARTAGGFVRNTAVDIGRQAYGASLALNPAITQGKIKRVNDANSILEAKKDSVTRDYKMGRMSKENYKRELQGLSKAFTGLSDESQKLIKEADPQARASDVAWTAINLALLGGGALVKTGTKAGAPLVSKGLLGKNVEKAVQTMENVVARTPAGKELLERNAMKVVSREKLKMNGEMTEQWLRRAGKDAAIGLLIKRPIFYQQNIGFANEAYQAILDGEYQDSLTPMAWLGAQMIGGGPLLAGFKKAKAHVGELSRGRGSFIDELSKRTDTNLAKYIEGTPDAEKTWRIAQATNMAATNNRAADAAEQFLQPYIQAGVDLKTVTEKELTEGMAKWAKADELRVKRISQGLIKGINASDVDKYAVVRWDSVMKDGLSRELAQISPSQTIDLNARQAMLSKLTEIAERPGVGWGNNELLMARLQNEVANADTVTQLAKAIKQINTASVALKGMPKKVAKEFSDLGYTIAAPFGGNRIARVDYDNLAETTHKIVTGAVKGETALFDPSKSPEPVLSTISSLLQKIGLTPEGSSDVAHRKLSEALIGDLGELKLDSRLGLVGKEGDFVNGGRAILSELQRYVETKKGAFLLNKISSGKSAVTDIRQLTNDEIAAALQVTKGEAKDVARAVRNAYMKVPLEVRGLGDKIVDYAIAIPGSPMRYYQRIQSAMRYTYNPFFRFQEQVETNLLASMDANKFIWAHRGLDDTARKLESAGLFSGNVFGAGADDAVIGRISANLTKFQKRNLAGLAETIAKGQGKTVDELLVDNPEQLDDALRMIVQYPKKGTLASPLARTINLAFFPMRYNAKVSTLAAEKLATLPPSIQFATVQGLFKMKEWLKSDEGLQWQADHADAIQVWSWASPLGNISQFYKVMSGNVDEAGDLGLLGGLPFGVISQILDGQGIININKPYVDPKTGDVLPDYIPQTTRARSAVALQDLLGTMFSFPGRTLGLPGKEANLRKAVGMFIDTNGTDFEKQINTDELTELQKKMIKVLKGDSSEETLNSLYYSPAPGQFDYYTIPPMTLPMIRPLVKPVEFQRRTGLPAKQKVARTGERTKPLPAPIVR